MSTAAPNLPANVPYRRAAADLARAIVKILSDSAGCRDIPCGIYNFASAGQASWYDFAKAIFELSGSSVELLPIPTSEYPTAARRPQFSVLDTSLIRNRFTSIVKELNDRAAKNNEIAVDATLNLSEKTKFTFKGESLFTLNFEQQELPMGAGNKAGAAKPAEE